MGMSDHCPPTRTKIYSLKDPITGLIRYIGKTSRSLEVRLACHLSESNRRQTHRHCWIRSLLALGASPEIELIETVDGDGCIEEINWIGTMKSFGCDLVNGTIGGESGMSGRTHTPEARAKISASGMGRKQSAESIAKRSLKLRRPCSEDKKRKISKANLGRKFSLEIRLKFSRAHMGIKLSREHVISARNARMLSTRQRGQSHTSAKLSESDVAEIRMATGTQVEIGRMYGVGQSVISRIRSGRVWTKNHSIDSGLNVV